MTKEQKYEALNLAFDGMLTAQTMLDYAETERDKELALALYHAFRGLWLVLAEKVK